MKKLLVYSGVVVLILLLIVFSVSLFLLTSTSARVARQRAAITAAGEPLYLTDYAREPIADEDNAAFYLRQAKADLEAFDKQYADFAPIDLQRRLRPEQVDELRKVVEQFSQNTRMYELLERVVACPDFDDQVDYSQGIAVLLPDVSLFRSTARACQLKAVVLAYDGKGDEALAECELSLRIAAHLQGEPLLITHLVCIACQGIAGQCINHVLRVAETSPAARQRLDAALAAHDNRPSSVAAMQGERAMGALTFAQLRSGQLDPNSLNGDRSSPTRFIVRTWLGQAYLNDDEAKYLELMDCYIEAAGLDAGERKPLVAQVESEVQAGGGRHMLTRMLIPALQSALKGSDRAETSNHCLRVLLALDGREQATLDDLPLPGPVKLDTAGVPLVIRHTEDGWLVYSVGENGVDDGGEVEGKKGNALDEGYVPLGEPLPAEAEKDAPSDDAASTLP